MLDRLLDSVFTLTSFAMPVLIIWGFILLVKIKKQLDGKEDN